MTISPLAGKPASKEMLVDLAHLEHEYFAQRPDLILVCAERDSVQVPWRSLGVDVALECTGKFTKRAEAAKHIEARGQKRPRFGAGRWRRPDRRHGVNHDRLMSGHKVISNPSCTTSTPRWHTYWKTCPRSHGIL